MTKKEEINKNNNIIIGIAAFAIIAIAIIVAINFFAPKSHAQVNGNDDKVAMSTLNKVNSQPLNFVRRDSFVDKQNYKKDVFKKDGFNEKNFANSFDKFAEKNKGEGSAVVFNDYDKTSFTFTSAKNKDAEKFSFFKVFAKDNKYAFNFKFNVEKAFQS